MNKCPKCGGTSGLIRKITIKYNQNVLWQGKVDSTEETEGGYCGTTGRCWDCGKRVNIKDLFKKGLTPQEEV